MTTKKEKITSKAIEVLKSNLDGVRYSDLIRKIHEEFPEIPVNTIHGTIWNLDARVPAEVYKPARGLFRYVVAGDGGNGEEEEKHPLEIEKIKEEDFYEPFADWLVNELEECTKAMPLGGNRFKDRWGTPDVIGKRESRKSDIVEAPTEIVSAEIKTNTRELITAFGQACAYKLFSHKSYIVIPKNSSQNDISKLDALCLIFGNYSGMLIGLPIAILYFLARKITAEGAEERRAFNRLFPLRVPLRTLRLNSRFGYSIPHVPGSSCIVKSPDSGFEYLSSYDFWDGAGFI